MFDWMKTALLKEKEIILIMNHSRVNKKNECFYHNYLIITYKYLYIHKNKTNP